jgi:hypothetical protein
MVPTDARNVSEQGKWSTGGGCAGPGLQDQCKYQRTIMQQEPVDERASPAVSRLFPVHNVFSSD